MLNFDLCHLTRCGAHVVSSPYSMPASRSGVTEDAVMDTKEKSGKKRVAEEDDDQVRLSVKYAYDFLSILVAYIINFSVMDS